MNNNKSTISTPHILEIKKVGECLLRITQDGVVEGSIENASEAGKVFVDAIKINLKSYLDRITELENLNKELMEINYRQQIRLTKAQNTINLKHLKRV